MKKQKENKKLIPASALGYAVSFMMLIGLICSGVLFMASANKRIEMNYELEEHMLFNNYFGLKFGASMREEGTRQIVHPSGDTTSVVVKNWGAFNAVVSTTFHNNRKVQKSALIGFKADHNFPVLYLPDHQQVIKLCGETLIEGDVFSSERGFERGYIAGKQFTGKKLLHGTLKKSERHLPLLKKSVLQQDFAYFLNSSLKIESFRKDSAFKFTDQTRLVTSIDAIYIENSVEGNIVFHSFDSICVSSTAKLKHVILLAPIIRFEKGFEGSVQAIAEKQISCEEGVKLNYPSALILTEKSERRNDIISGIFLADEVQVLGGVLLISEKPDFRRPVYLGIHNATIGGFVYNQGETELQGKIIGSLYTNKFTLRAGGGEYSGYLLDATLSSEKLPKEFIMPVWLEEEENGEPTLLTCF